MSTDNLKKILSYTLDIMELSANHPCITSHCIAVMREIQKYDNPKSPLLNVYKKRRIIIDSDDDKGEEDIEDKGDDKSEEGDDKSEEDDDKSEEEDVKVFSYKGVISSLTGDYDYVQYKNIVFRRGSHVCIQYTDSIGKLFFYAPAIIVNCLENSVECRFYKTDKYLPIQDANVIQYTRDYEMPYSSIMSLLETQGNTDHVTLMKTYVRSIKMYVGTRERVQWTPYNLHIFHLADSSKVYKTGIGMHIISTYTEPFTYYNNNKRVDIVESILSSPPSEGLVKITRDQEKCDACKLNVTVSYQFKNYRVGCDCAKKIASIISVRDAVILYRTRVNTKQSRANLRESLASTLERYF